VALPGEWVQHGVTHAPTRIAGHAFEERLDLDRTAAWLAVLAAERVNRRTPYARIRVGERSLQGRQRLRREVQVVQQPTAASSDAPLEAFETGD
jgi:hypothetical protein